MSLKASQRVWSESKQHGNALLVLLALADRADDDLTCWPGVEYIANQCRLKKRAVQAILAEIEEAGEIVREFRRGRGVQATTIYRLKPGEGVHDGARVHSDARVHDGARRGARRCIKGVHDGAHHPSGNRQESSLAGVEAEKPAGNRQRKAKVAPKPRVRDTILDALALVECSDLSQVPKSRWSKLAKVKSELLAVMPDLTPEEVTRRAEAYRRRFPNLSGYTATGLLQHWASLGAPPSSAPPASKRVITPSRPMEGDTDFFK